jgi:hypothetical protein
MHVHVLVLFQIDHLEQQNIVSYSFVVKCEYFSLDTVTVKRTE